MEVFKLTKPFFETNIRVFDNKYIVASDFCYALGLNYQTCVKKFKFINVNDIDGRSNWDGRIKIVIDFATAREMYSTVFESNTCDEAFKQFANPDLPVRKRRERSDEFDIRHELLDIREAIKATAMANIKESPEFKKIKEEIKEGIINFLNQF